MFFCGCGGGAGSPGSRGTEDTGVEEDATIMPLYLGDNTDSVEIFQVVCYPVRPPVGEDFTDHSATLKMIARLSIRTQLFRCEPSMFSSIPFSSGVYLIE